MPQILFTDRKLAGLKPAAQPCDYFDQALTGLVLRVYPTGRKTFMLLHRVNGQLQRFRLRDPDTGVSAYPKLTLAKARDAARAALQLSTVGRDPRAERKTAAERTFGALSTLYLEQHAKRKKRSWRDDARMIRKELEAWTDRPIAELRRADVRDVLEGIVSRGAPTLANRVLALVRKMFNFAVDREWLESNPAAKMARPASEQSRSRVLSADEVRSVWAWLEQPAPEDAEIDANHWRLTQVALKLRLLTAQRGGEVINMRSADVDLDAGWWTIPTEHAKNKLPHRVPLTSSAIALLRPIVTTERAFVFEGIRGPRHRRGVLDALPVADVRPHDFRRTAATMMASAGVPRLVIAKVLNHVDTGVTAVYDRASYDNEKRIALETWERTLKAILENKPSVGTVLPFTAAS